MISCFHGDRFQSVSVNGLPSTWNKITGGIPQESVLGSLLSVVFVNNLTKAVGNIVHIFADANELYGPANTQ